VSLELSIVENKSHTNKILFQTAIYKSSDAYNNL